MSTAATPGAAGAIGAPARTGRERRERLVSLVQSRVASAVLLAVAAIASVLFPHFLSRGNISDIVTASSFLGIVAIGQCFVIIMGGFDLAVGSTVGLGTVLAAYAMPYGWVAAFAAPILAGALIGLLDGLLIARARMAPFIVTLAALLAIRGASVLLAGESLIIANPGLFSRIPNGSIGGIGNLILILIALTAGAALVLNATSFGSAVFAIGGNEEAARMLGVRVERTKVIAYVFSGSLAGLSGALLGGHLDSGLSGAGTGYELQSIAACVIGGVLLTGGVGTLLGTLSGVLLLGVIENVINQIGTLNAAWQDFTSGLFLLAAVILQTALTRRRAT